MIIDSQSTKIDVISILGMPNASFNGMDSSILGAKAQMMMGKFNTGNNNNQPKLMHYKDCLTRSQSKLNNLFSAGSDTRNICKVFTVLLDNNKVVIAHAYFDNDLVTREKLSSLKEGISHKKDVINALAGPSSITQVDDKELYSYKTCVSTTNVSDGVLYHL